jgi:hypothetical protein
LLSGTLIPPIVIGISLLPPNGVSADAVSVGRWAMMNLLFIARKHSVFGLYPKVGKSLAQ